MKNILLIKSLICTLFISACNGYKEDINDIEIDINSPIMVNEDSSFVYTINANSYSDEINTSVFYTTDIILTTTVEEYINGEAILRLLNKDSLEIYTDTFNSNTVIVEEKMFTDTIYFLTFSLKDFSGQLELTLTKTD